MEKNIATDAVNHSFTQTEGSTKDMDEDIEIITVTDFELGENGDILDFNTFAKELSLDLGPDVDWLNNNAIKFSEDSKGTQISFNASMALDDTEEPYYISFASLEGSFFSIIDDSLIKNNFKDIVSEKDDSPNTKSENDLALPGEESIQIDQVTGLPETEAGLSSDTNDTISSNHADLQLAAYVVEAEIVETNDSLSFPDSRSSEEPISIEVVDQSIESISNNDIPLG